MIGAKAALRQFGIVRVAFDDLDVRGFVTILGSKGGEKIESTKNTSGERTYRIAKQ